MKKLSNPVVFFGSGPVAAESLALLANDFVIEAVITKPRPEHHKGSVPVLELAEHLKLPIYTATDLQSLDVLFRGRPFQSHLGILIDFGIIVSQQVIDYFPLGIINSHFSLLPEWRGADPITFSILSGQKQTGVSLMLLTEGLDEGPVLGYAPYDLPQTVTTPELTANLIQLSYQQLVALVPLYLAGKATPLAQPDATEATYSRKLTKEDGLLDFTKSAIQLEREIRAFIEWPKSRATFGTLQVILTKAHVVAQDGKPGARAIVDKLPAVFCGEGALVIDQIKPAGKPAMSGQAFLAGYKQLFLSEN